MHALSDRGAVVTTVTSGTTADGFHADWRQITVMTVRGDLGDRCEIYDEDEFDTALVRFDELNRAAPRLVNAATRVCDRLLEAFAARDWDAMTEFLDEDLVNEDRRHVVNAGVRRGRESMFDDLRASADIGIQQFVAVVIAARGDRLVLTRAKGPSDDRKDAFHVENLVIVQVDADDRIVAQILFDPGDLDAAIAELDARYLAGEAAGYARTWEATREVYAAANRHEAPEWSDAFDSIDHRKAVAFAPGELAEYLEASWAVAPGATIYVESVHRLSDIGVLVTYVSTGASHQGFDAEWRGLTITIFDRGKVARSELFDEDDLESALARFDELDAPSLRLDNRASRACERFRAAYAARDWDALTELLAENLYNEDRRSVVNAGIRHGRQSVLGDSRVAAEVGVPYFAATEVAIRGERLVLSRGWAPHDDRPDSFNVETIHINEVDAAGRITTIVMFDVDGLDAAFAELDARYLAGDAAAHADAWSVLTRNLDALNHGEIPTLADDFVDVDHRSGAQISSGDLLAYLAAALADSADNRIRVEAVHRLSDRGAVFTHVATATSQNGLEVEWRMIDLLTTDGERLTRCELFDEEDLDAALARFDELA